MAVKPTAGQRLAGSIGALTGAEGKNPTLSSLLSPES